VSTDRDALLDVLGAVDRLGLEAVNEEGLGAVCYAPPTLIALRDAVHRARRHLDREPEHDCAAEVERASRAAYAAGQARAVGDNP
jgi:hypothetical protein